MSTMDQQPRHGRRGRAAALLCGSLVFAAALAIALLVGGGGGRGWGEPSRRPPENSTTPLVATPEGAGPAPAAAAGVGAPVIQPVPTSPARPAATAPVAPPASKPTAAAKAAALVGASTQDALSALTAAAAATKGSAGEADKQQEQAQAQTGGGTCRVETAEELTDAVENGPCAVILLTSPDREAYVLEREVNVTRHVTVMGNPAWLPQIDAHYAVRAFHVLAGGYLDLRFVRVWQGMGTTRDRYGAEGMDLPTQVSELRGGSVAIERGALGGSFLGVTFLALANTPEAVEGAIAATMAGMGGRIYGGHVFIMDGDVQFTACNFWDATLVVPLTDQLVVGGDILVVSGNCRITATTFTVTSLLTYTAIIGGAVAVLGGSFVLTWSLEQAQYAFTSANGPGQTFWVGAGVLIMIGIDFRLVAAGLMYTGFGDFAVGGGVLVMTGVTITNAYSLMFAVGCGFYTAVGAGVLVQTGVTYSQQNGPAFNSLAGVSVFVGTGASINTGVPGNFFSSTELFAGIGLFSYTGAGVGTWVGCPLASYVAILASYGNGGVAAQSAGWLTWVGSPIFLAVAIEHFAGLGGAVYLGTGGAVVVGSPVYAPIALPFLQGNPANFVIGRQSFKKGKGATFAGGKTLVSTNANTSRRALQQELGPRARAGKRYLKGQSSASVPFPWAAFADAEVAPGQASILMSQTRSFDRVDPADPSQRAALAGWVPPGMLKAAEAIEALRTDLQAALGDQPPASPSSGPDGSSHRGTRRRSRHRRRQQKQEGEQEVAAATNRRDTLYVGENVAYCGACDVDSLSGPRAGACETDCAAVEARMSISSFDFGQVQFDPVHLVMAAIEAPLPAAAIADAGGGAAVAMDVRDALRLWLRSPVVDLPDAQVAVYAADGQEDGDELVRRWLAEEKEVAKAAHRGAMGASSCSQERLRLTAAFVVHDAEAAALLRWVVQGWDEQQMEEQEQQGGSTAAAGAAAAREALVGAVQGAWPAANGEQEGDCADLDGTPAISFQRSLFVPAYDSPEFLQEQQQQQQPGAASNAQPPINSLRLVDPLRPGVPLGAAGMGAQQNVVLGRSYRMELAGFPPQASVLVALVPVPSSDPGEADAGAAPQAVATLRTDDRGAARALWPVPRRLPPGDYYLQAAAGEGQGEEDDSIWGLSQLYKVATRPARRRKLGPVLEL